MDHIHFTETLLGNIDCISVLISPLLRDGVDLLFMTFHWDMPGSHVDLLKSLLRHRTGRNAVMRQALIARKVVEIVCLHVQQWKGKKYRDTIARKLIIFITDIPSLA